MNQKTKILSCIILLGTTLIFSMEQTCNNNTNTIRTINAIPTYYADLATKLSQQISCTTTGRARRESKILQLASWDDCKISEILNINARKISRDIDEHIMAFRYNDNQRYPNYYHHSFSSNCIGTGIESWIHRNYVTCHPITRKAIYKEIIENLKKNWRFATRQEYPTMTDTQSTNPYLLLIKKQNLICEGELITYLASKFNLNNIIMDYKNDSYNEIDDYEIEGTNDIYLWIKKDAIDTFKVIFNVDLTPLPFDIQKIQEHYDVPTMQLIELPTLSPYVHLTSILILISLCLYQGYILT